MKTARSLFIILIMALIINGCSGNIQFKAAKETIQVNQDLSGQVSQAIALSPYDFEQVGIFYSSNNPENEIAQGLANDFGWLIYDQRHWSEGGYEWVEITTTFADPEELYQLLEPSFSNETQGSGGNTDGSIVDGLNPDDYPPFSLTKEEKLFSIEYRLEGTLIALAATEATIEKATLYSHLPGSIDTSQTNGRILEDGQSVAWDWGQYDYVPYYHVTTMPHWRNIILVFCGFGVLIGSLVAFGSVGLVLWRKNWTKELQA